MLYDITIATLGPHVYLQFNHTVNIWLAYCRYITTLIYIAVLSIIANI